LEKEILTTTTHPFLPTMHYTFQSDSKLFFLMTYLRGGELFSHLRKSRHFPEKDAKFYSI
jgi:serine/threonine protein kinase